MADIMDGGYNGEYINDIEHAINLGNWVIPIINQHLVHGKILHTENIKEFLAELLDKYCGIDGMYIHTNNDIGGVALRIQECEHKDWGTITQRYSRATGTITEYEKRCRQLYENNEKCIYPHYTAHIYANTKKKIIYGGGFCFTRDLYDIIRNYEPLEDHYQIRNQLVYLDINRSDNNMFVVVKRIAFNLNQRPILEIPYIDMNK